MLGTAFQAREQKAQRPLACSRPSRRLRMAVEEGRGESGWEQGHVRPLAIGRSLACMLISEGFEQRRGMI